MINEIKIKSGILHNLLKTKTINFVPDMNIVWGRNGVGKSLLLKTIGSYCFVSQTGGGGWSQKDIWFKFSKYDYEYKMKDKNLSNVYEFDKNSKIDIDWSGDPCFYMHHDDMIDWTHIMGYEMSGCMWINGIGKIRDTVIKKHQYHPSTGQQIKGIVEMLLNIQVPDLTVEKEKSYCHDDTIDYINERKKKFKGEFKPTLLLDEVDSQLDLFNQMWFHKEIIPQLLKKYQIIMVSHSVFAAHYYSNIIELDDSLALVRKELNFIK
jgi:AAA15 family ATPase/GTPase